MENLQTDRELTAEIKLYYDLRLPETSGFPAPLLIAVHGYGGNKRSMMREIRGIAPDNFAVAVLQGFHQHWREPDAKSGKMPKVGFAWLTNYKSEDSVRVHHQAVRSLIENLINEGAADARQIYLLGFSQSCALNFRFAFSNPDLIAGAIGISGGIPGDWEQSDVYQTLDAPVFYLYGDADEFYPLAQFESNAERLNLRARDLQTQKYAAPHEITDDMRVDVHAWLKEKSGQ